MTVAIPDRIRPAARYLISFGTGILAGAVFALLKTPSPVPPLIGLTGLLSIATGEIGVKRSFALARSLKDRRNEHCRRPLWQRRARATSSAPADTEDAGLAAGQPDRHGDVPR